MSQGSSERAKRRRGSANVTKGKAHSVAQKRQLARLAALADEEIDASDIPEAPPSLPPQAARPPPRSTRTPQGACPSVRSYKLWPIELVQHGSLTLFCALRTGPSAGARWHDGPIGTAARVHNRPYAAPRGPAVRPQLLVEW